MILWPRFGGNQTKKAEGIYINISLLTPSIQLAESSRTAGSGSPLVLDVLYMLGARSRAKIECFKMHIRPKVRTFIEIWIFYS